MDGYCAQLHETTWFLWLFDFASLKIFVILNFFAESINSTSILRVEETDVNEKKNETKITLHSLFTLL